MAKLTKAKSFALRAGRGVIEEEAQFLTTHHRPTVQLLKFTEGKATGRYAIRFCHYDGKGKFQRSPLVIDAAEMRHLKKALASTPRLRKLLAQLG
ncbi:MAG TPA: hypothetical protein VEB21_09750 [Terriglobales bacterium]|nr:hypothetical protein [Terriglobales bacterium]